MAMKIGIFGDSWADINPEQHRRRDLNNLPWGLWLEEMLDAQVTCHANSSTGLWYSFDKFRKFYKKYNKIVFTYTEYGRWNGLEDGYESISNIREPNQLQWVVNEDQKEVATKLVDIHRVLYNDDLNLWIYQQIFNEVNDMCYQAGIDIINILAFEDGKIPINTSKTRGPIFYNMHRISVTEVQASNKLGDYLSQYFDIRFCHMNPHNNKVLANLIANSFKQPNNNATVHLPIIEDFEYDEKHLEYHFREWDKSEKRH
jgi:hypothetical protein